MRIRHPFILALLLVALALAACGTANPTSTAAIPPTSPATPVSLPTATPVVPSATATPAVSRALLVSPADANPSLAQDVKTLLTELAAQSRLTLEVRPLLQPADLNAQVKVVVFLAQPANLTELLAAAPTTQFAVVTAGNLAAKNHLSVVRANPEHLAFAAGYITTLISADWRSAALLPDQPKTLLEAFQNGGRYWCGRCVPNFAPVVFFPVGASLPSSSALPAWQSAFENLKKNILETVYVPAEVSTPELLAYLVGQKVNLVGGQPPAEAVKARWAVTVRQDALAALKTLWPDLAAGKGGKQLSAAITFSDINENLFTPGKQRLALEVIAALGDGTIAPLSVAP